MKFLIKTAHTETEVRYFLEPNMGITWLKSEAYVFDSSNKEHVHLAAVYTRVQRSRYPSERLWRVVPV